MKSIFLTCLFSFAILCCSGQVGKQLSGDTAFWYRLRYRDADKLGFIKLITSPDKFHFRLWRDQQTVDIWTTDGINYQGSVTSYTKSYEPYDYNKNDQRNLKLFFNKVDIDSINAKKASELIKDIALIPTDKSIKGWQQGFDGLEYNFETSTPSTYDFKNYWTPTAQSDSLTQAKRVQEFVNQMVKLLNLSAKYSHFFNTLKPGSYVGDGPMVAIKLTTRQQKYFDRTKPYRDYMQSISDTLNHYLSDTLTKMFSKHNTLACYDEFFLRFSKNNKLLKVTTNSNLSDKEDRQQFRMCRDKIIEAFRSIKIDFVHSKVGYIRELGFFDGKATVYYNGL